MTIKQYSLLLPPNWREKYIDAWLEEDLPNFDCAGYVVGDAKVSAQLLCKSSGVLAGGVFFQGIFDYLGCQTEWLVEEGAWLEGPKTRVAVVSGPAHRLLQGERVALNLLARLSGIATKTCRVLERVKRANWMGMLAGSRKTTPGFRLFEKYAVMIGGADGHRFDLSSCVMLKDNHIDAVGSIEKAIEAARLVAGFTRKIEVECRTETEALRAAASGADIIMLDNFSWIDANLAAEKVKLTYPHVIVEVSGGITEDSIVDYAHPHINVISMGSLTQGVPIVDFSLKIIT